ncbi:MAG: hypothetical protein P9M14_00470 [Candidatus Alcyoniella australis]|nr:hypothetical protein [Candidatus Alcyoniella australis]
MSKPIPRRKFIERASEIGLLLFAPMGLIESPPGQAPKPPAPLTIAASTTSHRSSYSFVGSSDPGFAERFVGERKTFNIEWMKILGVADIDISFDRGSAEHRYNTSFVLKLRNIYSALSRYGEMKIQSELISGTQRGKYRLMPLRTMVEHTFKGDLYVRQYKFDYDKHSYNLRKTKNGVETRNRDYTFRPNRVYDDPSSAFWNLRAGIYGDPTPGRHFKIRSLRFAGLKRYEGDVLKTDQLEPVSLLLTAYPQVHTVLSVDLSKQLFLGKPGGKVYIGFDKKMQPHFGLIPNIPSVGDVFALKK